MSTHEKSNESLLNILHAAETACANKDYSNANKLYTKAIQIDGNNPSYYGNRSVIKFYLQKYDDALEDAEMAVKIDAAYAMGYYRLGVAHQCLQQYNSALIAFAKGMSLDSKNFRFLQALVDTALRSPLQKSLQPVFDQLNGMNLERNPFVIISVIGQDLLAHNHAEAASEILECAITIGTCSLKLKGSVCSALSSALWSLKHYERAIFYMKEDLKVSQSLSDPSGECRAYGNLAAAYYHQNMLEQALQNYNKQLLTAETLQHNALIASACSGLGSVYSSLNEHQRALLHHERAADIYRDTSDFSLYCRELGKVSQALVATGDLQSSLERQKERLFISSKIKDGGWEEAQIQKDMADLYKALQEPEEEFSCLLRSAELYKSIDSSLEIKTLLSLGYAARNGGYFSTAMSSYERLLEVSLNNGDKSLEARSCANLGIVYHQMGKFDIALKFQARALHLATELGDVGSQGRAYGNIGNAYSASGLYEQAVENHLKELEISKSIGDKECECSTHGNLAVAYQALGNNDNAEIHYKSQFDLAEEIGDFANQGRALMNLANFYNTIRQYHHAIEFYKKYLTLPYDVTDATGRGRALYNFGFACFSLRDFSQAAACYRESVAIATEYQDKVAMARAYCNLGLADKALGDLDSALECQRVFFDLSNELNSSRGKFKALGNLGDLCVAQKRFKEALEYYEEQLQLSQSHNDPLFTAQACTSLGSTLRHLGQLAKASEFHAKECEIYRSVKDTKNEYKAQGRRGATLTALEHYADAITCYERQLEISQSELNPQSQTQAWANLAITHSNLRDYQSAKKAFESQIAVLEKISTKSARLEKCKAHCSVGDCCAAIELHTDAIENYQIALSLACELKNLSLVERSSAGSSSSAQSCGNIATAITWAEHRLKACQIINQAELSAAAYGELGYLYSQEKNYVNALRCLNEQMRIAVDVNDDALKSDAACGLGSVYLMMKDFEKALALHKLDLELAQRNSDRPCQGRAYGNIAACHEAMKNFAAAIPCREQHLFIAKEQDDELAKLVALHGIGRNTLQLQDGDYKRAALLLQQAMLLSHGGNRHDELIGTIYDLAIATWACGDLGNAVSHLYEAVKIAEDVCFDTFSSLENCYSFQDFLETYKLLCKSYSALICLLCSNEKVLEALIVAEKSKSFPDRLLTFETRAALHDSVSTAMMLDYVTKYDCLVLYYVITAGHLFQWIISPKNEITFAGMTDLKCGSEKPTVIQLLSDLQTSLGVSNTDDDDEATQRNVDSSCKKKSLYLQMLSVSAAYEYQLSHISTGKGSLLQETTAGSPTSKSPLYGLYEFLMSRIEKTLRSEICEQATVVADGDLLLVPFAMLKKRSIDGFLAEKFQVNVLPSFRHALQDRVLNAANLNYSRCVSIVNPALENSLHVASEEEAMIAGQVFGVEPVSGVEAGKSYVTSLLGSSEVLHFACGSSWGSISGILLGNAELKAELQPDFLDFSTPLPPTECNMKIDENSLLTSSDVLNCDLSATKLVIIGAPFHLKTENISQSCKFSTELSLFVKSLLFKGAGAVLLSLWPVPETASKVFYQNFFEQLATGCSTSCALAFAANKLRRDARFEHPSYWAGFVLVGHATHLNPSRVSLARALVEILREAPALSRETIKLSIHLLRKAMKKDDNGDSAPTYVSQESVSSRLHNSRGWRRLLTACHFELRPGAADIPNAIFFPPSADLDEIEKLTQHLSLFVAASDESLRSFGKLTTSPRSAASIGKWLDDVMQRQKSCLQGQETVLEFTVERKIWQTDGASELLKSLGFRLNQVELDSITLNLEHSHPMKHIATAAACLHFLFEKADDRLSEQNCGRSYQNKNLNFRESKLHNSFAMSSILNGLFADHGMDQPDFNSSFRSAESSNRISSASGEEMSILSFDEPKEFTQIPKSLNLIAPKPLSPQKSRMSTPENTSVAPGGGFSPSKKFVFASPLGNMLQSRRSSLPESSKSSSSRSLRSPTSPPVFLENTRASSSNINQEFHSNDPKVCVVSPQRESSNSFEPRSLTVSSNKFMSVFESLLINSEVSLPQQSREQLGIDSKIVEFSNVDSKKTSSDSSGSYKPSPSAASSIRTSSPQHEYSQIVDRFTHLDITNQKDRVQTRDDVVRSNTTSTHTAFRLVNQSDPSIPPKLQKYLIETQVSTVSTLLSEDNEVPVAAPLSSGEPHPKSGRPRALKPYNSIFKQLKPFNVKDKRVQFV